MNKNLLLVLALVLAIFFVYKAGESSPEKTVESKIENGVQVINLLAKGGYSPTTIEVKAGIPVKLKVETKNTFDCSSAFQIPSLKISSSLPPTGITEFDIPPLASGQIIQGNCSMYMYRFSIKAS